MSNKILKSIGFRISLISTVFTVSILIFMGFLINQHVINHFTQQNQAQVEGKLLLIENLLHQNPPDLQRNLDEALIGHKNLIIQIKNQEGAILYQTQNATQQLSQIQQRNHSKWLNWIDLPYNNQAIVRTKHLQLAQKPQTVEIIAGVETTDNIEFLHFFEQQLLLIGILGTLCIMFLGWFATWHGLQPIRKMAKISEKITANHLSKRLELGHAPIEVLPLATAFNQMLDRLEVSVDQLSAFSSDLAHEMRTPINNLMMQTQVCLTKKREIEEYQEVLFSNLEEYERMAKMVSDMLFLAKADHADQLKNRQNIHLEDELEALFEYFDAFAAEKNIILKQSGAAIISADPAMIRRAFNNLISNAIKYGQKNSSLDIQIQNLEENVILLIKNKVPIEMQHLSQTQLIRFFDRFYRLDAARQRTTEGTGLGLAITKSIIEMHQASIEVFLIGEFIVFKIIFKNINTQQA